MFKSNEEAFFITIVENLVTVEEKLAKEPISSSQDQQCLRQN